MNTPYILPLADEAATLETAAATISKLFVDALVLQAISDAIQNAYLTLDTPHPSTGEPSPLRTSLTSVAIRSSATAEDLPEASFAGQQPGEVLVAPITTPA